MLKINTTSPMPKNQRLTEFPTKALTRQPEISNIDESNNIFSDNLGNIFTLYAFRKRKGGVGVAYLPRQWFR